MGEEASRGGWEVVIPHYPAAVGKNSRSDRQKVTQKDRSDGNTFLARDIFCVGSELAPQHS